MRFSCIRLLLLHLQTNRLVSINDPNLWSLDAREMSSTPSAFAVQVMALVSMSGDQSVSFLPFQQFLSGLRLDNKKALGNMALPRA